MSAPVHPVAVEMFQLGPKWTDQLTMAMQRASLPAKRGTITHYKSYCVQVILYICKQQLR